VNINAPSDGHRLRAELEAQHGGVPLALARRIRELADNGLDLFEIQAILGVPLALARIVLRGGSPKEVK
jgi:hypothetical protein